MFVAKYVNGIAKNVFMLTTSEKQSSNNCIQYNTMKDRVVYSSYVKHP